MSILRGAVLGLVLVFSVAAPSEACPILTTHDVISACNVDKSCSGNDRCTGTTGTTSCDISIAGCDKPCGPPISCGDTGSGKPKCGDTGSSGSNRPPCETPPGVPEPATVTLLVAGLAALVSRVRRHLG